MMKIAAFSLGILVLGHLVSWDGRTVSDQIKSQLSHAESWAEHKVDVIRNGDHPRETISPSERQKLRQLIRELNREHAE
jgi:hypothetical protein